MAYIVPGSKGSFTEGSANRWAAQSPSQRLADQQGIDARHAADLRRNIWSHRIGDMVKMGVLGVAGGGMAGAALGAMSPAAAGLVPGSAATSPILNAASLAPGAIPYAGGMGVAPVVGGVTGGGGGGGGGWLGKLFGGFTGRDKAALATAGIDAGLNIWGTNKANSAADRAALAQQAQFDKSQAFLEAQAKQEHEDYLAAIEEQKRQWEAEQLEANRRYEAREPWREAGRQNIVRMNSLMDVPTPERLDLSFLRRG